MQTDVKEIDFYKYCKSCTHKNDMESQDPCHECLNNPIGINSTKPVMYEKSQKKQGV